MGTKKVDNIGKVLSDFSRKIPEMAQKMRKNAADLCPLHASNENLLIVKEIP